MLHLWLGTSKKEEKLWDTEESKLHINALEMKAVFFGLQTLYENVESFRIRAQVDTAVAVITKWGAQDPWIWTEKYTGYGIGLVQR